MDRIYHFQYVEVKTEQNFCFTIITVKKVVLKQTNKLSTCLSWNNLRKNWETKELKDSLMFF